MAFPTIDTTPSTYASTVFIRAKQVRAECVRYIAQCDAGAINLQDVAEAFMAGVLGPIKLELATIALVSGLFAELARQRPVAFADATAAQTAYQAAQTAIANLILFMEANLPVDGTRRLLSQTLSNDGSGTLAQRTITVAGSIASFRAALVTCRDAFEA
jgi:hypothetical protein